MSAWKVSIHGDYGEINSAGHQVSAWKTGRSFSTADDDPSSISELYEAKEAVWEGGGGSEGRHRHKPPAT